jgi:hypothetical protein
MDIIDLSLDNFENVASLDSRSDWTRHPLWTGRTPVPAMPGWSSRPARSPTVARTTASLCQRFSVSFSISIFPEGPEGQKSPADVMGARIPGSGDPTKSFNSVRETYIFVASGQLVTSRSRPKKPDRAGGAGPYLAHAHAEIRVCSGSKSN